VEFQAVLGEMEFPAIRVHKDQADLLEEMVSTESPVPKAIRGILGNLDVEEEKEALGYRGSMERTEYPDGEVKKDLGA